MELREQRLRIERVDLARPAPQPEQDHRVRRRSWHPVGLGRLHAQQVPQAKPQGRQRPDPHAVAAADPIAVPMQSRGDVEHGLSVVIRLLATNG